MHGYSWGRETGNGPFLVIYRYTACIQLCHRCSPLFLSTDELLISFLEDFQLEEVKYRRWQRDRCVEEVKWSAAT